MVKSIANTIYNVSKRSKQAVETCNLFFAANIEARFLANFKGVVSVDLEKETLVVNKDLLDNNKSISNEVNEILEKRKEQLVVDQAIAIVAKRDYDNAQKMLGLKTPELGVSGGIRTPPGPELIGGVQITKTGESEKESIRKEFRDRWFESTMGDYEWENMLIQKQVELYKMAGVDKNQVDKWYAKEKENLNLATAQSFTNTMASNLEMAARGGMVAGNVAKRAAQVQAMVDTYAGANAAFKAMAGIPVIGPALGAVAATAAIVAGLANVRMIESQQFARGGIVQGTGNIDNVSVMTTPGELILNRAQQENLVSEMGSNTYHYTINAIDSQSFEDFLRRGGNAVLAKQIQRGKLAI